MEKLSSNTFQNGRALDVHMGSHSPSSSPSSSFSSPEEFKRNATVRKRSKRTRRSKTSWFGNQQHFLEVNSIRNQNLSPEEVVAYCLIKLSRDKWENEVKGKNYRCEKCDKVFGSYQALGGHIASHKKVRLNNQFQHKSNQEMMKNVSVEDKIHECQVCFKVFDSGQALGGHKRSHISGKQVKRSIDLFDLNLPAPSYDDDD